jgi:hypothetical protein
MSTKFLSLHGTWTFFTYELRRLLPTAAVGLTLWPFCVLGRRLIVKDWNYWGDDSWALEGVALTLLALAVMAVAMASSGWAGERAQGTLAFTLARPLSAGRLFFARVAAVLTMLSAFAGVSLALQLGGSRTAERVAELLRFARFERLSFELSVWALGLGAILLAASLLASTLAASGRQMLGILVLILAAYPLFVLGLLQVVTMWSWQVLRGVYQIHWMLFLVALLAGAWGAVRRAPEDPGRWRRAAFLGGPVALVSGVVLLALVIHPLRLKEDRFLKALASDGTMSDGAPLDESDHPGNTALKSSEHKSMVLADHDLGEDVRLQLLGSTWMDWRLGVPRISHDGEETILPLALSPWQMHSDRRRGLSVSPQIQAAWWEAGPGLEPDYKAWIMWHWSQGKPFSRWIVIDRAGNHRQVVFPQSGLRLRAVGWSPSGEHFAWWDTDSKVVLANGDLEESRILDFATHRSGPRWSAGWAKPRHMPHWSDEDSLVWTSEVDETPGLVTVRILDPGGDVRDGCVLPLGLSRPRYPRFYGASEGWAVWGVKRLLLACHLETTEIRMFEISDRFGIVQGGIVHGGEEIPFTEMRAFAVPTDIPGGAR